jgi:hypothetical protein
MRLFWIDPQNIALSDLCCMYFWRYAIEPLFHLLKQDMVTHHSQTRWKRRRQIKEVSPSTAYSLSSRFQGQKDSKIGSSQSLVGICFSS